MPTQDAHREGAIRAFRGILDEVQTAKNMNVTGGTTLEELNLDPEKMNKLIPGHDFTKDTTLQELYKHRKDMQYQQKGALGKVIAYVAKRFGDNAPTTEVLKDFARQMINLSILDRVQEEVRTQVQEQQAQAQQENLPTDYKEHLKQERS